ncbi:PA2169 family four-helix-bundle protein [Parapedobacter lycopersici]|uniref:PA2169 family four-helix-bundle protein n=1 Tax=Parapedobacter lycopersici TaxID=1864939 RepID=UPI0033412E87
MEDLKKTAEVLNDLIKINNDRIEGYQRAITELPEINADLKGLFTRFVEQSEGLKAELQQHISAWDGKVDTQTTVSGKIYRAWMDIKAALASDDRKAILESCEYGEDAAQKAYRQAEQEEGISPAARALITNQKIQLLASHDQVKELRDREREEA